MKISNSKKQLAKIIHENGGWRDGMLFSWYGNKTKMGYFGVMQPRFDKASGSMFAYGVLGDNVVPFECEKVSNWHQTILSRDEYLHLYPAPDADGWIEWNGGECPVDAGTLVDVRFKDGMEMAGAPVGVTPDHFPRHLTSWKCSTAPSAIVAYRLHKTELANPEFCESVMRSIPEPSDNPTIEQLAAGYRNAKDYADRKQQEADAAKADAESKLAELVAAGKALGLVLSVAGVEPGLVITEIEDLLEGDVIELTGGWRYNKTECTMMNIPGVGLRAKSSSDADSDWWNLDGHQKTEWRFIRRP